MDNLEMKDLKAMDNKTLLSKVGELKEQLSKFKLKKYTTGWTKTHEYPVLKKNIAKLLTAYNSKKKSEKK